MTVGIVNASFVLYKKGLLIDGVLNDPLLNVCKKVYILILMQVLLNT